MEFREFDTYFGAIDNQFESSLNEFRDCFKECTNRLEELRAETEKHTAKSSFLLPKTPSAKRRKRRAPLEIVIEDDGESVSNAYSPRCTRSTRSKRNTSTREQNLENIVPETNSIRNSRRAASKNAGRKIKSQVSPSLTKKLRQQSIEVLEESEKRASDQNIEEGQRPSKSRRLNDECTEFESMVPLVERLNSTVIKETDSQTLESSINVCAEEKSMIPLVEKLNTTVTRGKVSHSVTSVDVSAKMQLVPLVEKLNINVENQKQSDNQLSEHIDNIHTSAVRNTSCSSVATKVSLSECKPNKESTERSYRLSRSKSSIENDENSRKSSASSVRDFTENNVTARDSLLEKDKKSFAVCENSKGNLSLKEAKNVANITITMEDKNKANLTFEIVPDENSCVPTVTDSVQGSIAKVGNETRRSSPRNSQVLKYIPESESVNVEEPCEKKQSPILSKTKKMSRFGHNSTPDAKCTKPVEKKSAEVFSPYANEPVRERVAAFERLQCLSEEPVESSASPEKAPTRITRTKTRAMAKAEAAAAKSEEENPSNKELNDNTAGNLYSNSVWKAARKSVAKAKKTSIKAQKQDKAIDEFEMSKENSMVMSTSKYNTPFCGMGKGTPLSSSNISNTNSAHRFVGFGSSTGRFQAKNIVVGVESLITKQHVKPTLEDINEMKEEEIRRRREKEEEARRKREEALKEKIDEKRRKREEKMQRVLKQREALEKQKLDSELRQQKEKEEKLKLTMQEREDKLKEQVMQKKQHAQQKAAEIEERRRLEEVSRLAKLKELEDEQLRLQAAKKKEQEELAKRQAEEKEAAALREQQAIKLYQMKLKLMNEKEELKLKMASKPGMLDKTFEIPKNGGKKKTHNYDDYGIDSSDCSDDEGLPTRPVPLWAKRENRLPVLRRQRYKCRYRECFNRIFVCEQTTPDLKLMFSQYNIKLKKRTSSAVWETPPCLNALPKY